MTLTLSSGANAPLSASAVTVSIARAAGEAPPVDLIALLVTPAGRVRADADMVFYNQPVHPSGAVRFDAGTGALVLDLARVEPAVAGIVIAVSAPGGFGPAGGLSCLVGDALRFDLLPEPGLTAVIAGEIYRHDAAWKFRAVGQGWATGLAGLARDFGLSVDDEPPPPVVAPPVVSPPAASAPVVSPPVVSPPAASAPAGTDDLLRERVATLRAGKSGGLFRTYAPRFLMFFMDGLAVDAVPRNSAHSSGRQARLNGQLAGERASIRAGEAARSLAGLLIDARAAEHVLHGRVGLPESVLAATHKRGSLIRWPLETDADARPRTLFAAVELVGAANLAKVRTRFDDAQGVPGLGDWAVVTSDHGSTRVVTAHGDWTLLVSVEDDPSGSADVPAMIDVLRAALPRLVAADQPAR